MEAEIKRIMVQGQPGQILCQTLSQKYPTHIHKKGLAEQLKWKSVYIAHEALSSTTSEHERQREKEY
jgi:hypothetical protein